MVTKVGSVCPHCGMKMGAGMGPGKGMGPMMGAAAADSEEEGPEVEVSIEGDPTSVRNILKGIIKP